MLSSSLCFYFLTPKKDFHLVCHHINLWFLNMSIRKKKYKHLGGNRNYLACKRRHNNKISSWSCEVYRNLLKDEKKNILMRTKKVTL